MPGHDIAGVAALASAVLLLLLLPPVGVHIRNSKQHADGWARASQTGANLSDYKQSRLRLAHRGRHFVVVNDAQQEARQCVEGLLVSMVHPHSCPARLRSKLSCQ